MKKIKVIFQVVIPYICITTLMVMSIYYLVKMLEANYREKIIDEQQMRIELAVERFQERIKTIEETAQLLSNNKLVKQYAYSEVANNVYSVTSSLELQEELRTYCMNNSLVDIFLYNRKSNKIISTNVAWSNAEYFFQYSYAIEGVLPHEQIDRLQSAIMGVEYSSVLNVYTNSFGAQKKTSAIQAIEYRRRVPFEWRGTYATQMVFVIEVTELFGDFYDIMENGNEFYVYDDNNRLMFGSGEQYEAFLDSSEESELTLVAGGKRQVYGAVQHTEDDNWRVKVFMPNMQNDGGMALSIVWFVVIVPVLASIILSFWFTFRNYSEIIEILCMFQTHGSISRNMKDSDKKLYGYQQIKKEVFKIIDENQQYRENLDDLKEEQKYYIMDKLVCDEYESREQITHALKKVDFDKWNSKVVVLCIWYEGSDYRRILNENQSVKKVVRNALSQFVEREAELFERTARESVCILFFKEADNISVVAKEIISKLNIEIFYPFDIKVKVGVGNRVDSIYEVAESYKQAKQVIKYKADVGKNMYLYSELTEQKDIYYYPSEYNDKICSYIVLGEAEIAKELIRKLYQENFEKNTILLSYEASYKLKQQLEKCVLSVAERYGIALERVLEHLHQTQDIGEYFDSLYDFVDLLTKGVEDWKEKEQNQLGNSVLKYIELHYNENSLGLKQIADEFGFQENYMSKLFKSIYGKNISATIEKTRMEKACDMLENTDMMISDISEKVGYSSDISFRRAFKKVMGVTPGEYREVRVKG